MAAVRVCLFMLVREDDPLRWRLADVPLPEGYGRVFAGKVREGDLYFNRHSVLAPAVDGKRPPAWRPCLPLPPHHIPEEEEVSSYDCVIRPGALSEPACERCGHQRRFSGERYCVWCRRIVVREGRRAAP